MFDPSKMDPKVLMELSQIVRELPPDKLYKMQTLMHNMMAGFDVSKEMEEFERNLPPGFREKLMGLMAGQMGSGAAAAPPIEVSPEPAVTSPDMDVHSARITVLKAVAEGRMSPAEAEKILFPSG